MSESIPLNLGRDAEPPLGKAVLGCVFATADAFAAAAAALLGAGIEAGDIHVGAASPERAEELSLRSGAASDIAPDDPLGGIHGYAGEAVARTAVDRAGVWGAALGTAVGALVGRTPLAHVLPVDPSLQMLASVLFCFVVGLFIGSIIGAALAPQRSTHAAFRLIDGMSDGGIALIVTTPAAQASEITRLLEQAGARDLTQL